MNCTAIASGITAYATTPECPLWFRYRWNGGIISAVAASMARSYGGKSVRAMKWRNP
jgi:hypothetical protein